MEKIWNKNDIWHDGERKRFCYIKKWNLNSKEWCIFVSTKDHNSIIQKSYRSERIFTTIDVLSATASTTAFIFMKTKAWRLRLQLEIGHRPYQNKARTVRMFLIFSFNLEYRVDFKYGWQSRGVIWKVRPELTNNNNGKVFNRITVTKCLFKSKSELFYLEIVLTQFKKK